MSATITFGCVGDICLYGLGDDTSKCINRNLRFSKHLNQLVDISIANLEFVIVPNDYINRKNMAVSVSMLSELPGAGFDIYCLANNHTMDHGGKMLSHTQSYLDENNIRHVGAGRNINESREICYLDKNNLITAIINVTDATHYKATKKNPGINPYKKSKVLKDINEAKKYADLVIVSVHSDYEFSNLPAPWKVRDSREFVEAGADLVLHHHSHTLQGIENWGKGLIVYSLGNFIFPVYGNSYMENQVGNVNKSCYLKVSITINDDKSKQIEYEVLPTIIERNNITILASKKEAEEICESILRFSERLKNMQYLQEQYYNLCKKKITDYFFGTYYELRKKGGLSGIKYFLHHFKSKMHRHMFYGLITKGRY